MFETLLIHYDIKDFIEFLGKKKFLSTLELKRIPNGTKQEITNHLDLLFSRDQLDVFRQYTTFVSEDVALILSETSFDKKESDSDSFSSSSFSDESDPCQPSQESPTVSLAQPRKNKKILIIGTCIYMYTCKNNGEFLQ